MNIKRAYTLMELMLTTIIIAGISTILIRTVFSNQPNKHQLMAKKIYTETSNIVSQMVNNEDLYGNTDGANASNFSNTAAVEYKGQTYGSTTADSNNAKAKFCNIFKTYLNIAKTNHACDEANVTLDNGGHVITSDGVIWVLPFTNFNDANATYEILVDVVSTGQGDTNCTSEGDTELTRCTNGPDRFKILVRQDGRIEVPATDKVLRYYLNHAEYNKGYKAIKDKL